MAQTPLEKCLDCIIDIFHQYSMREEPHDRLSQAEFSKLMKEQLPNFMQANRNPEPVDSLFKELDQDEDTLLNFEEFVTFVDKS